MRHDGRAHEAESQGYIVEQPVDVIGSANEYDDDDDDDLIGAVVAALVSAARRRVFRSPRDETN